jgi:hypothetical protein
MLPRTGKMAGKLHVVSPKDLWKTAQGCRAAATPGNVMQCHFNPERGCVMWHAFCETPSVRQEHLPRP